MYDPVTTNSTVVPFCSFIIPSYNEAPQIHTTLDQIKTYMDARKYDWEIIVVNDCSTQKRYYEYNWEENGIIIIHLEENSKKKFGI